MGRDGATERNLPIIEVTPRQYSVLKKLHSLVPDKQAAHELGIGYCTFKDAIYNMRRNSGLSRMGLVLAFERGQIKKREWQGQKPGVKSTRNKIHLRI